MTELHPGDPAPDFQLPADGNATISLSALRGRAIVLFFYPKDDTSLCTTEAMEFSALKADFDRLGVPVIGLSPDSAKKHDRFKAKHGISLNLVSDEEKTALIAYGVWKEKTMYGRRYMGVERTTFLIDWEGNVARVWRKVRVAGHAREVLDAAAVLTSTAN